MSVEEWFFFWTINKALVMLSMLNYTPEFIKYIFIYRNTLFYFTILILLNSIFSYNPTVTYIVKSVYISEMIHRRGEYSLPLYFFVNTDR
jgi:hypothetical protein